MTIKKKEAESSRFLIGNEVASRGIPAAVEALKLLYQISFIELKLERIYGTIASDNKLMIKWQKYLGMREDKRLEGHYFLNNKLQDAVCLSILASDYHLVALPKMMVLIATARKGINL